MTIKLTKGILNCHSYIMENTQWMFMLLISHDDVKVIAAENP